MAPSIIDRFRLMRTYLKGDAHRVPGPFWIALETTALCNLRCPMCPRTNAGLLQGNLPGELLYPALDEAARLGCENVSLYGLGEPFLDGRIFDILERCRNLGLTTTLSSNGTLLDAERRSRLLEVGCDHFIVGIDGTTQATYEYYRAGGHFEQVVENVRALAAEKVARNGRMTLVVQMIRMRRNRSEQDEFIRIWSNVRGIDSVRLKEEDIGLREHAMKLDGLMKRTNPCHLLWIGPLCVRHTGDVFPCSRMLMANSNRLGNLREAKLDELWNSQEMRRIRRLHAEGLYAEDPVCKDCKLLRIRLPFVLGAMAVPTRIVQRWVPVVERMTLPIPWLLSERWSATNEGPHHPP
jgi:radical SAM protein with 4Fe4S-binding SPASM domain